VKQSSIVVISMAIVGNSLLQDVLYSDNMISFDKNYKTLTQICHFTRLL